MDMFKKFSIIALLFFACRASVFAVAIFDIPVKSGSMIVSDAQLNRIYTFDPYDTSINNLRKIAEDTTGSVINNPEKMAITKDGKIIVADFNAWDTPANAKSGYRRIYEIDPAADSLRVIAEAKPGEDGPFLCPLGVVIADDGNLIVIDHGTNAAKGKIVKINYLTGAVMNTVTASHIYSPQGIVKDPLSGKTYISDHNGYIFELNETSFSLKEIGIVPEPGSWSLPQDLIVDKNGKLVISTLLGKLFVMDTATGSTSMIFNDASISAFAAFDSIDWLDDNTFIAVNHHGGSYSDPFFGDIISFDYNLETRSIAGYHTLYNDGLKYGGDLIIPLGIERYNAAGSIPVVPEPSTLILLGSIVTGLFFKRKFE
jgi:sugar lactone lactonase YvrE